MSSDSSAKFWEKKNQAEEVQSLDYDAENLYVISLGLKHGISPLDITKDLLNLSQKKN